MSRCGRSGCLILFVLTVLTTTMWGCSGPPRTIEAVLWVGGFAHEFDKIADVMTKTLPEQVPIRIQVVRDGGFLDAAADPPDVIIMNHCYQSAEGVVSAPQQRKLLDLVRDGVGVVAIHASYYSFLEWDGFHDLFGARWIDHGPVGVTLQVRAVDDRHVIMNGLVEQFEVASELYRSTPLSDDCRVLAMAKEKDTDAEYPSVWVRTYGKGRVVTILPGHAPDAYEVPAFQDLMVSSTRWAARRIH